MDSFFTAVDKSIKQGIAYLYQHQYPNGEFCCYTAPDDPMQEWTVPDSTIFPTALIANSLYFLAGTPEIDEMLIQTDHFLEYHMQHGGIWGHFTKWHPYFSITPCDVDDTVCTAIVLNKKYKYNHFGNKPLILANRNRKGLFYTWIVFRPAHITKRRFWGIALREALNPVKSYFFWRINECNRNDIDAVVNANALYYFGDIVETQPIIEYLLKIIANHKEHDCDKWYRNPYTIYYFISRNYYAGITRLEPARKPVIERILASAKPNGQLGKTELDTALAVCTLLNWHYLSPEVDKAIHFLINTQGRNGNWTRQLVYYGGPKKLIGWGSEEFTTGFCLEALARYRQSLTNKAGLEDRQSNMNI